MIHIILLALGNLSLHFSALSNHNTLQSVILPLIDFVFIFYLLVRTVLLINALGFSQQLEDYVDLNNSSDEPTSDEIKREQLYRYAHGPQRQTKTLTFIEGLLMIYAYFSYITVIAHVVMS